MTQMTITEALAELKTISKRISSKRSFINQHLARTDAVKDPLEKDGGSATVISQELQAVGDLETRIVDLRRGIQKANDATSIIIEGDTRTISDWLIWRREVAPIRSEFLSKLNSTLKDVRSMAQRSGAQMLSMGASPQKPDDVVVNINEKDLAAQREKLEQILGNLDGQLSLKNATTMIA